MRLSFVSFPNAKLTLFFVLSWLLFHASFCHAQQEQEQEQDNEFIDGCNDYQASIVLQESSSAGSVYLNYLVRALADTSSEGTLSIQFIFQNANGLAFVPWLGFGVAANQNGRMIGSHAVVGQQTTSSSSSSVMDYILSSKSRITEFESSVILSSDYYVNETTAVLEFTTPLVHPNRHTIYGNKAQENYFVYAIGSGPAISYPHFYYNAFSLLLSPCANQVYSSEYWDLYQDANDGNDNDNNDNDDSSAITIIDASSFRNKSLWLVHGILASIAWGLLAPVAIACSILRTYFGQGDAQSQWFQYHFYLQSSVVLLTIVAFVIAIIATNEDTLEGETPIHFGTYLHKLLGLILAIWVVMQAVAGIARPHIATNNDNSSHKKPPPPPEAHITNDTMARDTEKTNPHRDDDENDNDEENGGYAAAAAPEKSSLRIIWEIGHRVSGMLLLCACWFQIHIGITRFRDIFDDGSASNAVFWGCIAGVVSIILILYVQKPKI